MAKLLSRLGQLKRKKWSRGMLLAVWVLEEGNATRGQMVFARFNDDIPALLFRLPTQRLLLRQVGICCGFTMDSVRDSV